MSALKYLGVIVLLIGVAVLAFPALAGVLTNTCLLIGLLLVVLGYVGHIYLNKKIES